MTDPSDRTSESGSVSEERSVDSEDDVEDGSENDDGGGSENDVEDGSEETRERSFRGISRRLAAHYLTNVGGTLVGTEDPAEATRVEGDGWVATLSATKVNPIGSITLTEVTVVFRGDAETLDPVVEAFAQKAMRAGG